MVAEDGFAELLGRLKERSGLSYGVLAKRLHTSASTLHRYVNGDAVPADYAPVERFARACRATPDELIHLHRLWILADARRRRNDTPPAPAPASTAPPPAETAAAAPKPTPAQEPEAEPNPAPAEPAAADPGAPPSPRPRGRLVLSGAAVAAALLSAALFSALGGGLLPTGGDGGRDGRRPAGAAGATVSASPSAPDGTATPAPSPTGSASHGTGTGTGPGGEGEAKDKGRPEGGGKTVHAPTVTVDPYMWEGPCSQHYLVDQKPEHVPPPPGEPDARGWVTALGGVSGGRQMLEVTVHGTGSAAVVLEQLHVRVVAKNPPPAWNDYVMGVGCGGGVETTAFGVDLDAGRPEVVPRAGQRDFPYKVSESDPEVFYVFADARAHDVSWYLELEWSGGGERHTVRVDDRGAPFRTSGNVGRPAYTYPLGDSEWGRDAQNPRIRG